MLKPEVFVSHAKGKFNAQGQLTDETTLQFIRDQMIALRRWIIRERAAALAEAQFAGTAQAL